MTAGLFSHQSEMREGIRPVEPRRDMLSIADLMEIAFAGQLGTEGQRMVKEMRTFGRVGWLGWLLGHLFLPPAANPQGYVWEEDGRLVGNASLLAVEGYARRWVLANVAVLPQYRRRGIARELVMASLDLARELGAHELVLQVRSSNQAALDMYRSLGFSTLAARTTWRRQAWQASPALVDKACVRRRKPDEWQAQWSLARRTHPEGLVWPYPLRPNRFRPSPLESLLYFATDRHWVWSEGDKLLASLSTRYTIGQSVWRFVLITEAEARGRVESGLIACALAELHSEAAVVLDYPAGVAEDQLSSLGFRPERTLTWMVRDLNRGEGGRTGRAEPADSAFAPIGPADSAS